MMDPNLQTCHRYSTVTALAKDYHRIYIALTRAIDGLIIVSGQTLLLHTTNTNEDNLWNTPSAMVRDLEKRKLIYSDLTTLDSHPEAVKEREAMSAAQKTMIEQRTSEMDRFAFMKQMVKMGHQIKQNPDSDMDEQIGTEVEEAAFPTPPRAE